MKEPSGGEQAMASRCPLVRVERAPRLSVVVALLLSLCPLVAHAQDDDTSRRAAAQALFDQASALMDRHDYAGACPKLEEVARLQPGKVGTLMSLGECFTGAGRVASAWTTYRQAADRATTLNDPRAATAQARAEALAPKLPHLTLRVDPSTGGIAGLEVSQDGVTIGRGAWETPIPIDPGEHVVEARAPDHAPFRATVVLAEGESKDVAIALQPAPPGAQPVTTGSGRRTAGFVVGGVGVAGLAVGGILGVVTLMKASSANASSACIDGAHTGGSNAMACNTLLDGARALQTGGIIAAVVGGVAFGTGAVLVATAPRAASTPPAPVAWSLILHPTGASVVGRF